MSSAYPAIRSWWNSGWIRRRCRRCSSPSVVSRLSPIIRFAACIVGPLRNAAVRADEHVAHEVRVVQQARPGTSAGAGPRRRRTSRPLPSRPIGSRRKPAERREARHGRARAERTRTLRCGRHAPRVPRRGPAWDHADTMPRCRRSFPTATDACGHPRRTSRPSSRSARACDLEDFGEVDMHEDWVRDDWVRPRFDVRPTPGSSRSPARRDRRVRVHVGRGAVHDLRLRRLGPPAAPGLGIGTALVWRWRRRAAPRRSRVPAGSALRVHQSFDADASGARAPDLSEPARCSSAWGTGRARVPAHADRCPGRFDRGRCAGRHRDPAARRGDDPAIFTVMDEGFRQHWGYRPSPRSGCSSGTRRPPSTPALVRRSRGRRDR